MDIERLKGLKDYMDKCLYHATNEEPWENSYKNVESHKTVIVLIDEAIARQSVKSEEVQEAMPVVRCKECGYYDTTGYPALNPGTGWCDKMDRGVHDDFYCSYGERRK